ncbi:UNVERIFIED_CONTAM: hypothetical protein FKN15_061042 [Acipenser sinensis]
MLTLTCVWFQPVRSETAHIWYQKWGAPMTIEMESIRELIARINRDTAAQIERTAKLVRWTREMGWAPPKIQEWEQANADPQSPEPEREELLPPLPEPRGEELLLPEPTEVELPLPEPREEELPLPEPRGEELPLPEPRGEQPPLPEPSEEVKSIPPPQPRPPPLRSSSSPLRPVPHPLLQDTLPVFPDLPVLDLEPRSVQHGPQLCPWFPAPLSPNTQTSLGCCQTSLLLPLFAASLPLGDRTSLRWSPGEDLCPLLHPPVPRSTLRSPLLDRGVPLSPVRGPCLAGPGCGPIHPQVRPWKRAKKDIYGLEDDARPIERRPLRAPIHGQLWNSLDSNQRRPGYRAHPAL